tara:strand:- start:337 stop:534 length:198 start_codon:yes stop_codon:yes gene_type:complete
MDKNPFSSKNINNSLNNSMIESYASAVKPTKMRKSLAENKTDSHKKQKFLTDMNDFEINIDAPAT